MLFEECVRGRRSVRKFSDQDISQSVLEEIVDLARFSPSWKNTQVPRYHVIKNPQIKEEIARNCVLNFDFNAKIILRCKALVLVTVVEKLTGYEPDGSFSTSQGDRWEMFDGGIATQTFCLSAYAKGVGSVILGVFDENKIRQHISLPQGERVTNLIALGYPLEPAKAAPPRKDVSELLHVVE